jgi:hypothetical protein
MRRGFGIAFVASLVLLAPVIAQIGGRPMVIMTARVFGPVSDPEIPGGPPPFMRNGARLATNQGGPVNAEMALRALQLWENGRFTHNAVYFRFRVVPAPPPTPNAMIQIAADGSEANIQNRQFMDVGYLQGGGKGSLLIFRARALRYDNNNPPNRVEQQGTVVLLIEDHAPGASQRPNPGAPPDRIGTLIYVEGNYSYTYTGVVVAGDIYTHVRVIPSNF